MIRVVQRVITVVAVAAIAGATWVSIPVRTALACSTGDEYDFVAGSTSVVLGTVVYVGQMQILPPRTSKSDPEPSPNYDRMTPVRIEVARTLRGTEQPSTIEAYAAIRDPENEGNLPCLPLAREVILGREAVISLSGPVDRPLLFSGPQYWPVDQPTEGQPWRQVLQSVLNGTYPGVSAAGSGLAGSSDAVPGTLRAAGGMLMLAGAGLSLGTVRKRAR